MDLENMQDSEAQSVEGKEELKKANERRINALLHINNRYVRTARHLEQHSDITSYDRLKKSFKLQEEREARMENLKDIIAYGKHSEINERERVKRHLEFTDHYLHHHASHMDEYTRSKTLEKQEHRREQLQFLD